MSKLRRFFAWFTHSF